MSTPPRESQTEAGGAPPALGDGTASPTLYSFSSSVDQQQLRELRTPPPAGRTRASPGRSHRGGPLGPRTSRTRIIRRPIFFDELPNSTSTPPTVSTPRPPRRSSVVVLRLTPDRLRRVKHDRGPFVTLKLPSIRLQQAVPARRVSTSTRSIETPGLTPADTSSCSELAWESEFGRRALGNDVFNSVTGALLRQPRRRGDGMAPVKDTSAVHAAIKDIIQDLSEIQIETHGFVPETQELLVDKMTDLAGSLARLQTLTAPPAASGAPSPNYIHQVQIAPEIVDYVDDGRNPDIFTRDFVENVQRGNAVINGKQRAFRDFSEIYAQALKEGIPGIGRQVDRVMENAGFPMASARDGTSRGHTSGQNGNQSG